MQRMLQNLCQQSYRLTSQYLHSFGPLLKFLALNYFVVTLNFACLFIYLYLLNYAFNNSN
jgi:hypothetical protein